MNAIHANHSRQPHHEDLSEVWQDLALRANTFVQLVCGAAGVAGVASLSIVPTRWLCVPLALILVGCFALTSLLLRAELFALALVFGGSVGVMRG